MILSARSVMRNGIGGFLFFMAISHHAIAAFSTSVTPAPTGTSPVQQVTVTVTHIMQNQSAAPSSYTCPTGGTQLNQPTFIAASVDFPFSNGTHTYFFRCAETYWSKNDSYYTSLVSSTAVSCQTGGGYCSIKPDSALSGYIPVKIVAKRPSRFTRNDSYPAQAPGGGGGYQMQGIEVWFPFSFYIASNLPNAPQYPSACTSSGNNDCVFLSYASAGNWYTFQFWFDIQYQMTYSNYWRQGTVGGDSGGHSSYQAWCPAYGNSPQNFYFSADQVGKTCVYACDEANWWMSPWYYPVGGTGTFTINAPLKQVVCY